MVGRGSPWAAQEMETSWPVSATRSCGGWRNTGITVQHREKLSLGWEMNQGKQRNLCGKKHSMEKQSCWAAARARALQRGSSSPCALSLPRSLFINLFNLCSLFSAPLHLSLGQLHRNVLHHLNPWIQRLSRKDAPAETGIMTCFRNCQMRLSQSASQARLSNYMDLAGLKTFCEFCAWSFTNFMLLESCLPSRLSLAKPCPVCEQEGKFACLEA